MDTRNEKEQFIATMVSLRQQWVNAFKNLLESQLNIPLTPDSFLYRHLKCALETFSHCAVYLAPELGQNQTSIDPIIIETYFACSYGYLEMALKNLVENGQQEPNIGRLDEIIAYILGSTNLALKTLTESTVYSKDMVGIYSGRLESYKIRIRDTILSKPPFTALKIVNESEWLLLTAINFNAPTTSSIYKTLAQHGNPQYLNKQVCLIDVNHATNLKRIPLKSNTLFCSMKTIATGTIDSVVHHPVDTKKPKLKRSASFC